MHKHKIAIVGMGFVGSAVSVGLEPIADIWEHDKFKDSHSLDTVVNECEIIFLALPTPMNDNGSCNISIIEGVIDQAVHLATSKKTFIIKSTIPPGTTKRLSQTYPKHTFIFNPEFLTERNFINDFLEQDRIFLGTITERKEEQGSDILKVMKLYNDFVKTQDISGEVFIVDSSAAEMLKYVTNSFLATKVSFFNEMAEICGAVGVDYKDVVAMLMMDKRIGKSHLQVPGPDGKKGWGGSCFPKDVNALIAFAIKHNIDPLMLESAWTKNLVVREECEWEDLAQVTGNYVRNK
jgi:UDPglucose 6-dehydrogenase